jgi:hypothetical protein
VESFWSSPEGVRVAADGSWRVGGFLIQHEPSLRYLKARLVFEDEGVFIRDGSQSMPVEVEGPPFEVVRLLLDEETPAARITLDDGTEETIGDDSLGMNPDSGRFECRVRKGRARAVLSRAAHQTLIENAREDGGSFFLAVGRRRIPIRT